MSGELFVTLFFGYFFFVITYIFIIGSKKALDFFVIHETLNIIAGIIGIVLSALIILFIGLGAYFVEY